MTISLPILEREVGSAQEMRGRLNQQIERLKKEETALRGQLKQAAATAPASSQWTDDPRSQTTGNYANAFANTQPEAPTETKSFGMTARLQSLGLTKPDAMTRVVEGRVGTEASKIQELERQLELAIRARLAAEARLKTEGKALQKVEEEIARSARAVTLLQKELERERSATASREQELASLRERSRTLLTDLEGARATLPAMQQDHQAAQAELEAMRLKLADALDAAVTTRDQLRAQIDNREAVEKTLREAQSSNSQFTEEHAALLKGGEAARTSLAAARSEHAELTASHANAVAELAQLRNALTDSIAQATEARDALAAQKSIQERATNERATLIAERAALLAQDAQAAEVFRSEEAERERVRTERTRIETEREAQSQAELARLAVAVRTATDTVALRERELSELETQQRVHRAALTAQQNTLQAAEREKSDIAVQLAQLAASNNTADSALKLATNARTRREQDVQRLADENAQLAQSLRATQLTLEAERFRLRALHADAQTLAAQERHEAHDRAREERIGRAHQRAQAITAVARDRASDARYRLQAEQEVAALRETLLQLDEQTRGHAERRAHSERQLASERETVTRLAAAQHEAQQEINLRMEALAALNEERQLLTHEKQTLSEQCEQLAATVRAHESEAQRLREVSTQANEARAQAQVDADAQAQVETHRLAAQALGDVLHERRTALADLHAQRQAIDEQLRQARLAHAHACADQGQQIAQQQARCAELTALLNTSEAQAAHAATLFAAFEEEQSARKTVQTLAQQQVQRELTQVEQALRTARHSLREVRVDAKRDALARSNEVRVLAEQATQSRVAHAQARATARALFARLEHEQAGVHTLGAQVAEHSAEHEGLAQQIKQLREAVENANTQMVAQQAVASELGTQAAQARDQVEAQRALQRTLRDQTRQLESANRQAQEEIARLELSARKAQSDLEQAQAREQRVRGDLRTLETQHAQIQDELNTQRSALSATQANLSGVAQQEARSAHQAVLDQAHQAEHTLALAQHTAAQEQQQHAQMLAQLTAETQALRSRLLIEEAALRADLDTQHRAHEARVSEHAAQRATLAQARQDAELLATTSVKELALLEANTRDAQQRLSAQAEQLREANSALARGEAAVKESHDALRRSKQLAAQHTSQRTSETDEEPRQSGFFGGMPRWGWLASGAAALGIAATGVYVANTAETPTPAQSPVAPIAVSAPKPSTPVAPVTPTGPMTWSADGTQSQKHGLHFAVTLAPRAALTTESK